MNAPILARRVFKTSRLAEFCSQKELVNQTGHATEDWPLVILKELVDNALDGAEEAGVAPVIFRLFARGKLVEEAVEKTIEEMPEEPCAVPDDLDTRVKHYLDENPESLWEEAIRHAVTEIGGTA